jgi:hypothetical protein
VTSSYPVELYAAAFSKGAIHSGHEACGCRDEHHERPEGGPHGACTRDDRFVTQSENLGGGVSVWAETADSARPAAAPDGPELRTESPILPPWGRWAGRSAPRRGQRLIGTPRRSVIALDVRGVWPAH